MYTQYAMDASMHVCVCVCVCVCHSKSAQDASTGASVTRCQQHNARKRMAVAEERATAAAKSVSAFLTAECAGGVTVLKGDTASTAITLSTTANNITSSPPILHYFHSHATAPSMLTAMNTLAATKTPTTIISR